MIPDKTLKIFKFGCFVMHPSLLPKYRGATPIQTCLLNDDKITGVSICEALPYKFDSGDIIVQEKFEILSYYRFKELASILSKAGGERVMNFILNYNSNMKTKKLQDESQISYAHLFKDSKICYLDFNSSCQSVYNKYRAFYGSYLEPYSKVSFDDKIKFVFFENLAIVKENSSYYQNILKVAESLSQINPGGFYWDIKIEKNLLFIKCVDNWLMTNKIKVEGLGYLNAEDFIIKVFKNQRFLKEEQKEIKKKINSKELKDKELKYRAISLDKI